MATIKSFGLCMLLLAMTVVTPFSVVQAILADSSSITVRPSKDTYYYREPINVYGNFTKNGVPVSSGLVGISIYNPSSPPLPVAFRTVKVGQLPSTYPLEFVELAPCDQMGNFISSFVPGQMLWVRFTIKNLDQLEHYVVCTITVFDANGVPLLARYVFFGTLVPGGFTSSFFMTGQYMPASAQPGSATLVGCAFSGLPKDGGVPYCEEKRTNFEIKRNPEIVYSAPPIANPPQPNGTFTTSFKLIADSRPGDYQVYVGAQLPQSQLTVQNTTLFSLINAGMPPQAAFTYYPVESYVNMTITFDASASTAEEYNVSIVNYEWDFNDGSPKVNVGSPITTHKFTQVKDYLVTLNVTDSQGLWSTTSKIVGILPPTGPQADFIWHPSTPGANQPATFDASATKLGWNGTGHPPIADYVWNFGDGNTTTVYGPTIVHSYATYGNYTVILNVTDISGFTGSVNKIVRVRVSGIDGDLNGDLIVDIFDAILLASAYGTRPGDPDWNPNADINDDGVVDIFDAIILAGNYGKTG